MSGATGDVSADSSPATDRTRTRGTGGYPTLLLAMGRKRFIHMKRYPMNTLSGLVTTFILFATVFFGGSALSKQALTDSLAGIVVGFFLFTLAMTAFSGLSWSVTRESQWDTLEQLSMSPFGFGRVMIAHILVRIVESFLWGAAVLAFMLGLSGASVHLDVVTILPLAVLAVAPAVGIGFVFGGLALLFKRVENVFQLVQFVFIGLIAAPVSGIVWLRLLPVSQGSYVLTRAMTEGLRLWEIPTGDLALLVATAVGYLAVGYAVFLWAARRARQQGLMGKY